MLNQVQHDRNSVMMDFFRKLLGQKLINYYHLCQAILANFVYGFPSRQLKVIGVTGTDGKTTTVNLIASVLQAGGHRVSFLSTINAKIGDKNYDTGLHTTTPSSFLLQKLLREMVRSGSKFAVIEVTSHALDQYRTWGIKFETAVLTNITPEHLDFHKTFEEYARAKAKLFKNVEYGIMNIENSTPKPDLRSTSGQVSPLPTLPWRGEGSRERSSRVLTYGFDPKAQIWADNIKEDLHSTSFIFNIQHSKFNIQMYLPGRFNILNALAAICVGQIYKIPQDKITAGLQKVKSIPGRMEFIDEGQIFLALVDFAHTPNALKNLLAFLRPKIAGKIILVFGSAGERDAQKRPEMGRAADEFADLIILTREDNRSESVQQICNEIASGVRHKNYDRDFCVILDRREAIKFALSKAAKNDIVVVTGKGHEQSLNIDGRDVPWDDRRVMREELQLLLSFRA